MIDHDHASALWLCACAWTYNLSHFLDRFREGFWTGSAYSEPVHAPELDQNRHNVKRRCVNRFNFEICPWTILAIGTHWVVPRVHEPVQKQWTGSEWPVNRFTRNLFWCATFNPEIKSWCTRDPWCKSICHTKQERYFIVVTPLRAYWVPVWWFSDSGGGVSCL